MKTTSIILGGKVLDVPSLLVPIDPVEFMKIPYQLLRDYGSNAYPTRVDHAELKQRYYVDESKQIAIYRVDYHL